MVMRGEKMPKSTAWREATVGNAGRSYKRIWCEDCRHGLVIHARDIIEKLLVPPATPYWTLTYLLSAVPADRKRPA